MKNYRHRLLYICTLLLVSICGSAQWDESEYATETNSYQEIQLNQKQEIVTAEYRTPIVTGNSDLRARYKGSAFEYNDYQPPKRQPKQLPNVNITGGLGLIFKLILVLAGAFLIYILYRVFSDFQYAKKNSLDKVENKPIRQSTEDLEEEIDRESLTFLIQDAKSSSNYTLAIRYYFLLYLEKLQENKILVYHREKTNSDYLSEIKDTNRSTQFLKVSYLFEYAWYGKKQ